MFLTSVVKRVICVILVALLLMCNTAFLKVSAVEGDYKVTVTYGVAVMPGLETVPVENLKDVTVTETPYLPYCDLLERDCIQYKGEVSVLKEENEKLRQALSEASIEMKIQGTDMVSKNNHPVGFFFIFVVSIVCACAYGVIQGEK